MLDFPFLMLVTHPVAFIACLIALYALCYVPALLMRQPAVGMPDPAFLATFATPPTQEGAYYTSAAVLESPAHTTTVPARVEPPAVAQARSRVLNRALAQALRNADLGHYVVDPGLWSRCQRLAQARGVEQAVEAIVAINAAARATRPSITLPVGMPVVEHLPVRGVTLNSSAARMRAQRAAYAAQGLTARGTTPAPVCTGTTKAGAACKRKAQQHSDRCNTHL